MEARHFDVATAFLNGQLDHEVYMRLPRGMSVGGKTMGRLRKSLYGLKQSAHVWHSLSEKWLLNHDSRLKKSSVDPCLFVIIEENLKVVISTHVDDYIVASNDPAWIANFKNEFSKAFNISDLGRAEHVLQMAIDWGDDSVEISQKRFISELVDKYGLTDAKPIQTPMERDLQLKPAETPDVSLPYRSIIGSLQWIQRGTRPDISFAVTYLARFANCYDASHFKAAKRVLRYLNTTKDKCLVYRREPGQKVNSKLNLVAYTDSDWGTDKNDRRSYSGSVVYVNGCLVGWKCSKQHTVALSSVEAEYMALSDCTRETLYVINILKEFFNVQLPVKILCDNIGAGCMAENEINNQRTKHIDIRYHMVRQHIANKTVDLQHVPTKENIADMLTKALGPEIFNKLCPKLLDIKNHNH